jgi:hypothetical protein
MKNPVLCIPSYNFVSCIQENLGQVQKSFCFQCCTLKSMATYDLFLISGVPVWLNNHAYMKPTYDKRAGTNVTLTKVPPPPTFYCSISFPIWIRTVVWLNYNDLF